jgi:hypothetical protein
METSSQHPEVKYFIVCKGIALGKEAERQVCVEALDRPVFANSLR